MVKNKNIIQNIFVTVGNGKFEPLVRKLDQLKKEGKILPRITIQLGHGEYKPANCAWFAFAPHLEKYYSTADLIISHGGPGTVFEILHLKKKLVALPNRDRTDPRHQVEYLEAMAKETSALIYCEDAEKIEEAIKKAETHNFVSYQPPACSIHLKIQELLERSKE